MHHSLPTHCGLHAIPDKSFPGSSFEPPTIPPRTVSLFNDASPACSSSAQGHNGCSKSVHEQFSWWADGGRKIGCQLLLLRESSARSVSRQNSWWCGRRRRKRPGVGTWWCWLFEMWDRLSRCCESLKLFFSLLVMSALSYVVLAGSKLLSSVLGCTYALLQSICRSPRGMRFFIIVCRNEIIELSNKRIVVERQRRRTLVHRAFLSSQKSRLCLRLQCIENVFPQRHFPQCIVLKFFCVHSLLSEVKGIGASCFDVVRWDSGSHLYRVLSRS